MTLKVKTAAPGRSWLVFDKDTKIAAVHKTDEGFLVAQQGEITCTSNATGVRKRLGLTKEWEPEVKEIENQSTSDLDGYQTDCEVYHDPMIEVKRRLPLYTKILDSKCYFAAGWYRVQFGGKMRVEFCPKLLTLNRNRFWGPFHTEEEAMSLND
jgi:hypothetical protein